MFKKITLALALLSTPLITHAQISTHDCNDINSNATIIDSVPYHIYSSGTYCLNKSLQYGGAGNSVSDAIVISSSDVTLDLNGHSLIGSNSPNFTTTNVFAASGIHVSEEQNVTIKNGTIDGFQAGVHFGNQGAWASHIIVEDMRIVNSISAGISSFNLKCNGCVIRNNYFSTNVNGIKLTSPKNTQIINNTFVDIAATTTSSSGISISWGDNTLVKGNHFSGVGIDKGIGLAFNYFGSRNLIIDNTFNMLERGIYTTSSGAEYLINNITGYVATPVYGNPTIKGTNIF